VPYTQANRFLRIDTPLGPDVLLIESFQAREGISQPFAIHVDAISELTKADQVTAEALIGKNACITLTLKNGKRYFHGMISRLIQGGRGTGKEDVFVRFQLEMVPKLARFGARTDCRIFQDLSVTDIVQKVLDGIEVNVKLTKPHTVRDYCVQYRETDLNFVSRLMEDEGISYFFEHSDSSHVMVLADDRDANQPCPVQNSAHYEAEGGYGDREDTVGDWSVTEQLRPGLMTLRDHHFQLPDKTLEVSDPTSIQRGDNSKLEIYDYPGDYSKLFKEPEKRLGEVEKEGQKLVHLRMEREETAYEEANGTSDVRAFCSGFRFTLTDHFRAAWNTDWLLTSVQHSAVQSPNYRSDQAIGQAYSNRFTCIPYKIPFLPERITPKPVVRGPHTAVVVGPPGEEIFPDKFGRVKVQFFWDRLGKKDDNSSCWTRVSHPWAGKNWGFVAIPRIGHEVVVEFLEGDPDQPIIVGSVYNAENMPPYALPDNKTQTGIKTRSSTGGGSANFNEIRFEDKKGHELIHVQAEANLSTVVEANETRTVGGGRTTTIHKHDDTLTLDEGNRVETITKGDDTLTVKEGDRTTTLDMGDEALTVTLGGITVKAPAGTYTLEALEVIIKASTHLLIQCGSSKIEMTPATITLTSPMINLNP
jgi:type VI secretion system secreted protein VgrG